MFKPRTLAEVYCLTNLQEATLNAMKRKNKMLYGGGSSVNRNSTIAIVNPNSKPLLALPANKSSVTNKPINRRLTQQEYAGKRAKNLCFYSDKKIYPWQQM